MKKTIILLAFYSFFFCTKSYAQITTVCGNDSIKLKIQNHKLGILEWEKSSDAIHWEKIRNEHDTTYVFKPEETAYYRSVNKSPNCEPVFSSQTLVQKSPTASAGGDRLANDTFLFLGGNTVTGSTGTWSVLEGSGGVFSNINSPLTKFSGTTGDYKLQWKLENSCGVSKDSLIVKFVENQNHDKIVIVDITDTVHSTEEQLANGEYIIEFNDPVPTLIDDETILIGITGSGYLRKVDSVSRSGNTFTMTTSQGNLSDLLIEGGFDLGNIFEIDSILPLSKTRNPQVLNEIPTRGEILSNPKFRKGAVHYYLIKEEVVSLNNSVKMKKTRSKTNRTNEGRTTIEFAVNDKTLFDRNGINIKLGGDLTFTPNIFSYLEKRSLLVVKFHKVVVHNWS